MSYWVRQRARGKARGRDEGVCPNPSPHLHPILHRTRPFQPLRNPLIYKAVDIMGVIRNPGQGEPQALDLAGKPQGNPFGWGLAKAYAPPCLDRPKKLEKKTKKVAGRLDDLEDPDCAVRGTTKCSVSRSRSAGVY